MKHEVLRSCPVSSAVTWKERGTERARKGGGLCRRPAVGTDQLCPGLCGARVTGRGMQRVAGRWVCKLR